MSKSRTSFVLLLWLTILAAAGASAYLIRHYPVAPMPAPKLASVPIPHVQSDGSIALAMPNGNLVGSVGRYPTELTAYLRLKYLQSLQPLAAAKILVRRPDGSHHPDYRLYVVLPNDYISQSNLLLKLQNDGQIPGFHLSSPPSSEIHTWSLQTLTLQQVYQPDPDKPLLDLPRNLLIPALTRFILFKSRTDPREQLHLIPPEKFLSPNDARLFAVDMIDVASFYHIPLSMLIGVGAMENNFLDVRGDLHHTVWMRHRHRGDIVLRRRRGWYLVKDFSLGPWQITQGTLRYAHLLYRRDTRDYSQLPPRLRPSRSLDLANVGTPVLTTYAGLILRNLLNKFHGNRQKAAGAYNGGDRRPNMHYSQGVFLVGDYARRVINHAIEQDQMRQLLENAPPPSSPPAWANQLHLYELSRLSKPQKQKLRAPSSPQPSTCQSTPSADS